MKNYQVKNGYEIYTSSSMDHTFVSLSDNKNISLIWPPSEVNINSFVNDPNNKNISISFLKVEGDGNSYHKLLQFLGEKQLSKSIFYDDYILPKMKEFSSNTRDAIVLSLLRNLESLESTDPTFVNKLLKHPFLPTGTQSQKLCHISNVYVPEPKLRRFLDEDVMPSPSFSAPDIIKILSRIGLKRDMDLNGILLSAKSITKKLKLNNRNNMITKFDDNILLAAKQRSQALLKYLDENWLELKENHFKHNNDDEKKQNKDELQEWEVEANKHNKDELQQEWDV
eukprot:341908_1